MDTKPQVTKDVLTLIDDCYMHPNTSPLIFRFEPQNFSELDVRLKNASVKHGSIAGKDLYILDDFFVASEGEEMRNYSQNASFSRQSYGSPEAIAKGEKPAHTMNGKERWQFFSNPPAAMNAAYKFFSLLGEKLHADITTIPWELCDQSGHSSPAVIANKLEEASEESRELGKHQDCNPEGRISFGIPVLYAQAKEIYPPQFVNGASGNPWLVSVMIYTTAGNFLPDYRLGTVFYENQNTIAVRVNCVNMRMVLFEGDLLHSIEESSISGDVKTWRISHVYKLMLNPRYKEQNVKQEFQKWMRSLSNIETLSKSRE